MIKKSFIFVFAMVFIATYSLGLHAQTIPTSFKRTIGYTQPTGGPSTTSYDVDPTDIAWISYYGGGSVTVNTTYPGSHNAIAAQFPPILDASNSTATVVYKQTELGLNTACVIVRMQIPVYMDPANSGPWDAYIKMERTSSFAFHQSTPIQIYMRNGAEFNARGNQPVALSSWTNVFTGEWNPNNGQLDWNGISDTALLTIEFTTPFNYTGGDISVAFQNKCADQIPAQISSIYTNGWYPHYHYRMKCFTSSEESASNEYLGPKMSFSPNLAISYKIAVDAENLATSFFSYSWLIPAAGGAWYDVTQTGSGVADPTQYTFSGPKAPKGTGTYAMGGTDIGSIRPKVTFEIGLQECTTNVIASVAEPTQRLVDTNYRIARFDIQMDGPYFPLKLKNIKFNVSGSKSGLLPKMNLYRSSTGNITDAVLLGSLQTTSTSTHTFTLQTAYTLADGHNYFFVTYDIPKPTAANGFNCGDDMVFNLVSYTLGDRAAITGDNSDHEITANISQTKQMEFFEPIISNSDNRTKRFCYDEVSTITLKLAGENLITGRLLGTYYGFRWDRSPDGGETWEIGVSDQQDYTFTKDLNYNAYRGKLLHPSSCTGMDSIIYNIIWERTFKNDDVSIEYSGALTPTELQNVPQGSSLRFVSTVEVPDNSLPSYRWQVNRNSTGWIDIASEISSALNYAPAVGVSGTYSIRLRIEASKPTCVCSTVVYSNIVQFKVADAEVGFEFVNQPPANKYLCLTDKLDIMISYAGKIDGSRSCWQKDGQDLLVNGLPVRNRHLELSGLNLFSSGEYCYKAVDTIVTMVGGQYITNPNNISYSNICKVEMIPGLEIYYVSQSQNYVMPGKSAGFIVYSSWVDNEKGEFDTLGFQWYKHNANGTDVKLEDDYYHKGTRSNSLVITEAPEGKDNPIYTANGDYYFLKITGPCGSIDSKNHPIFLMPGEGVEFIKNNTNAIICTGATTATFEVAVHANKMEFAKYQWYVDNVAVQDGDDYTGATTPKLTINSSTAINQLTTFCKVTAFVNNYYINVNSDIASVEFSDMELVAKNPAFDDIKIADSINVGVIIKTNTPGSGFIFTVSKDSDVLESQTFLPEELGLSAQKSFTFKIRKSLYTWDNDSYEIVATVTDDCGNVVEAKWTIDTKEEGAIIDNNTDITENAQLNEIALTPNPANNIISVSYNSEVEVPTSIELCGLAGNNISMLFEGVSNAGNNRFEFDLSKFGIASGTYILKISNKNGIATKQFIFVK